MKWNVIESIPVFLYSFIFICHKKVQIKYKVIMILQAFLMQLAIFKYNEKGEVFFILLSVLILYGVLCQWLFKCGFISEKSFYQLFMMYMMLPFIFSMRIFLDWAEIL